MSIDQKPELHRYTVIVVVGIVTEDPGLASKYQTMLRNVVNSAAPILAELSEFEGKLEVFNVEEDNVPPAVDG